MRNLSYYSSFAEFLKIQLQTSSDYFIAFTQDFSLSKDNKITFMYVKIKKNNILSVPPFQMRLLWILQALQNGN